MNTRFVPVLILGTFLCAVAHAGDGSHKGACKEYFQKVKDFIKERENSEDFPSCLKNISKEVIQIAELFKAAYNNSDNSERKQKIDEAKKKWKALPEEEKKAAKECRRKIYEYAKTNMSDEPSPCKEFMDKMKEKFKSFRESES